MKTLLFDDALLEVSFGSFLVCVLSAFQTLFYFITILNTITSTPRNLHLLEYLKFSTFDEIDVLKRLPLPTKHFPLYHLHRPHLHRQFHLQGPPFIYKSLCAL